MSKYYQAYIACADYYKERRTVGALLLLWNAEILYADYLRGIAR
jgi:hypothetical protein